MYIEPNSDIAVLKNTKLRFNSEDTLWFGSVTDQQNYFNSKVFKRFEKYSYIRQQRKLRVECSADLLYDCDYLMYRNTSFGNKWFYAFITDVEYINNAVAELTLEFDDLQTWFFETELQECFVERMHQEKDFIGANIIEEGLELGEYVENNPNTESMFTNLLNQWLVLASSYNVYTDEPAEGQLYSHIYAGVKYYFFPLSQFGVERLNNLIIELTEKNKADSILGVFQMPRIIDFEEETANKIDFTYPAPTEDKIDGYIPVNKKLFTYPFNFISASNMQGETVAYRYENIVKPSPELQLISQIPTEFTLETCISMNPSVMLYPKNYYGKSNDYLQGITLNNFPQCSYNINGFKDWLANNYGNIASSVLNTVISGLDIYGRLQAGDLRAIGNGVGLAQQVVSKMGQVTQATLAPPQSRGHNDGNLQTALGIKDFYLARKSIKGRLAIQIDSFFSAYGYKQNHIMIPKQCIRTNCTYVKTVGCSVTGNLPSTAKENIQKIYDNGIRFWRNETVMFDYTFNYPLEV